MVIGVPSVWREMGYRVAEFIYGFLDKKKERDRELIEEKERILNEKLNMIESAKADSEWEKQHLRDELAIARGEVTFLKEKMLEGDGFTAEVEEPVEETDGGS